MSIPAGLSLPTSACPIELSDHELLAYIAASTAAIAAGGGGGGGGLTAVPIGNTVFVDAINGDDATGARGQLAKPFLTLTAAVAAATDGDTIYVWPGTYSDSQLSFNGNFYFEDGAIVTSGDDNPMFNVVAGQTLSISGRGDFQMTNPGGNPDVIFMTTGATVSFQAKRMRAFGHCIAQTGGTLLPSSVDVLDMTAGNGAGFWWETNPGTNAGDANIHIGHLICSGGDYPGIFLFGGDGTENLFFTIDQFDIVGENGGIATSNVMAGTRVWVNMQFMDIDTVTSPTMLLSGGKVYVTGLKVRGQIQAATSEFHLTAQKLNGQIIASGFCNLDIGVFDDTDLTSVPLVTVSNNSTFLRFNTCVLSGSGNSLFEVDGGLLEIKEGDFTAIAGQAGSTITAGTVRVSSRINMSAVAGASPINITHGTPNPIVILESDAKLITDGTAHSVVVDTSTVTIISQGAGNVGLGTGVSATGSFTVIAGLQ